MKKLSQAQIRVLRALAEPANKATFISGLDAYWFYSLSLRKIRYASMEAIIKAQFVDVTKNYFGDYERAVINSAGREYLAKLEKSNAPQI